MADFDEVKGVNLVRVHLLVQGTGSAALIGPVTFFLHDTFSKQDAQVRSEDGVAELTVTAYGGFTVGAWVHNPGVPLELDLSRLPNAPRVIREI